MLDIYCEGSPTEVGLTHGKEAKKEIHGSIEFYKHKFRTVSKLDWDAVRKVAAEYEPIIEKQWPHLFEELKGVAHGASVPLTDIVAINVRTEIAFGMFSDGCTSLSWHSDNSSNNFSYLAQNWDWMAAQSVNVVKLTIKQPDKPVIKIMTEAGLVGKIGLNSAGVGICFNAIRALGVSPEKLPCHLALRLALEQRSRDEAVSVLEKWGVASSCYMCIADGEKGGLGIEWSHLDGVRIEGNGNERDGERRVTHANHWIGVHDQRVLDTQWIRDSFKRQSRIDILCGELDERKKKEREGLSVEDVKGLFKDEEGLPAAISRKETSNSEAETIFNIVMDLKKRRAWIHFGRPSEPAKESFEFRFG